MALIRNILAIIGLLVLVAVVAGIVKYESVLHRLSLFDENAVPTYRTLGANLLESGNAAEATVWKVKVNEGLSADDVEETMRSVANEHNIKNVGELPLYKEVEAMSGKPYRFIKIYMFCNALTAAKMIDYSDAFSAYLPCRVTLLEDKSGGLWLYSLNMDLMIHGGEPLPAGLKSEAMQVKEIILDIMNRGAAGEF
jgi:uncharacterized protein (DUF302 family)